MEVRLALKKYFQSYGHPQLNRERFGEFAIFSKMKVFPLASVDYDQVS